MTDNAFKQIEEAIRETMPHIASNHSSPDRHRIKQPLEKALATLKAMQEEVPDELQQSLEGTGTRTAIFNAAQLVNKWMGKC